MRNDFIRSFSYSYNSPSRYQFGDKTIVFPPEELSKYAALLCQYHKTYKRIEEWLFNKFPNHEIVLRRRIIHYWDQKKFGNAIRAAKKVSIFKKNKKFPISYLIKAYVKIGKYKKAKSVFKKYTNQKLITKEEIEASFKVDSNFIDKDFNRII